MHHLTLAAYYLLAQSIYRFCTSKKSGIGEIRLVDCTSKKGGIGEIRLVDCTSKKGGIGEIRLVDCTS